MRFRDILFSIGATFLFLPIGAQTLDQARKDVQTLCSDPMAGRGYQANGHGLAAKFIAERFSEIGLEPWSPDSVTGRLTWFQSFNFQVNSVDSLFLKVNNKTLRPGHDYILHPFSGSARGKYKAKDLEYGMGEDWEASKAQNKAVLLRLGYPPHYDQDSRSREMFTSQTEFAFKLEMAALYKPALMMIRKEKLTAGLASQALSYPIIEIHKSALPKKIKSVEADIQTKTQEVSTFNVMGCVPGSQFPDSLIIVSAHYDHLGKQGEAIFRGANDNASGIAFMLALAGELQKPENQPACTIVFIAFGAEEGGLKGSKYFVDHLNSSLKTRIKYVLNFDLMSNGNEGICLVAGTDFPALADKVKVALPKEIPLELRPNAPNSDHYPFIKAGVPALFTYTKGGPAWYHDVYDVPEVLVFPQWENLKTTYLNVILNRN